MTNPIKSANSYFYLAGSDYEGLIGSHSALKALDLECVEDEGISFESGGMECNHLIPGSFFKNGPRATKHLYGYIPTLPLQRKEHRGSSASKSFHHMKRFGINDYLRSKGLAITNSVYSAAEVESAMGACREWYAKIGMNHAVAAIDEFRERIYMVERSRANAADTGR
jgi:hypothetical protein